MTRTLVLLCVSVLLLASSGAVSAFTLLSKQWPPGTTTVYYYVNANSRDMSPAQALHAVKAAAHAWNHVQSGIQLVYAGPTSATNFSRNGLNEVFFSDAPGSTGGLHRDWDDGTYTVEGDILLRQSIRTFFAEDQNCSNGTFVRDILTHEFGHMLGLNHSQHNLASMYPTTNYCKQMWRTLDADDRAGILAIHPNPNGVPAILPHLDASWFVNQKGKSKARLTWVLDTPGYVDVWRDGGRIKTRPNNGAWEAGTRPGQTHSFAVCKEGSATACTDTVLVSQG